MLRSIDTPVLELVARRLKAMADASRLAVLRSLCDGERSVTSLVAETGLAQANVSKHLRVLRDEGLVASRRDRRNVRYSLRNTLPEDICDMICETMGREFHGAPRRGSRGGRMKR